MIGKIVRHEIPDNTGMVHLCDSATHPGQETGRQKRLRKFPLGITVKLEEAHFMGKTRVYRAYNEDRDMDYFTEHEIEILK